MNKAGTAILVKYVRAFELAFADFSDAGYTPTRRKLERLLREGAARTKDLAVLAHLHRTALGFQMGLAAEYDDLKRMRALAAQLEDLTFRSITEESLSYATFIRLAAKNDKEEARELITELRRRIRVYEAEIAGAKTVAENAQHFVRSKSTKRVKGQSSGTRTRRAS